MTEEPTGSVATSGEPAAETPAIQDVRALVFQIVDGLAAALVKLRIYRKEHPRVTEAVAAVASAIARLPSVDGESGLRLSVTDELLVHRGEPLVGASLTASRLIATIAAHGSGGIEIDATVSDDDVAALLVALATRARDGGDWQALNAIFVQEQRRTIRLLPPFLVDDPDAIDALARPVRLYQSCMDRLQDVTVAICHGGTIDFGPVSELALAIFDRADDGREPLINLAVQEQYDSFTFGHSVRVAVLAMTFARTLTEDRDLLVRIGTAALLHDCGKALVPFELLHARRPLDAAERREMSRHAQLGAEVLLDHDDADPLSIAVAFGHHRSCDGSGYPATKRDVHNVLVTEVVKICDVYEALTAARPYKRPMSPTRAYRVMLGMGEHLDRQLLLRFIVAIGLFPTGQVVRLSDGSIGRVVAQSEDLRRPRVWVLFGPDGAPVNAEAGLLLDLTSPAMQELHIAGIVDERAYAAERMKVAAKTQ